MIREKNQQQQFTLGEIGEPGADPSILLSSASNQELFISSVSVRAPSGSSWEAGGTSRRDWSRAAAGRGVTRVRPRGVGQQQG